MIIGTAGHIDHGKTSLIRVLTGFETDRLVEEKKRGMSIEVGFAYMDLAMNKRVGIVDVPGHSSFIRNMLAGVHGISFVILVVAADDGIMPQTKEHLDIIDLLGISNGIVVITKSDLVDEERIDKVKEEIAAILKSRNMEGAPLLPLSSVTGKGVAELKSEIDNKLIDITLESKKGFFRMPIDRSFTIKGFGTVATGTVINGSVAVGQTLRLFPGRKELRVRNLEAHGEKWDKISAGDRCAINLSGIDKGEIRRGDMLTSEELGRETFNFDAKVKAAGFSTKTIKAGERVHLHVGTAHIIATFHPVFMKELPSGGESFASFKLSSPLQVMRGDRFILRDYSASRTIGGGVILNPSPRRVKKSERHSYFEIWSGDDIELLLKDLLKRSGGFGKVEMLAETLNIEASNILSKIEEAELFRFSDDMVILKDILINVGNEVKKSLRSFHKSNPSKGGIEAETLRQQLTVPVTQSLYKEIIGDLITEGIIEKNGNFLKLRGMGKTISSDEESVRRGFLVLLNEKGYQTVSETVLTGGDKAKRAPLYGMVRDGDVTQLSKDNFITSQNLKKAESLMVNHFKGKNTLTVIEFKKLLKTGRKGTILILEYFDNRHQTVRRGDERVLFRSSN